MIARIPGPGTTSMTTPTAMRPNPRMVTAMRLPLDPAHLTTSANRAITRAYRHTFGGGAEGASWWRGPLRGDSCSPVVDVRPGTLQGIPRLRVEAPPSEGRAKAGAQKVLTKLLGLPVRLVGGAQSRRKRFEADRRGAMLEAKLRDVFAD